MTIIRDLERGLVSAARSREMADDSSRSVGRRVRTAIAYVLVAFAVTSAGAAVVVLGAGISDDPGREVAVPKDPDASRVEALTAHVAVLRRKPTSVDVLPERIVRVFDLDRSLIRRVASGSGVSAYVGVARKGEVLEICQFIRADDGSGSSGCNRAETVSNGREPILQSKTTIEGLGQAFFALVPDAVESVRLELRGGDEVELEPQSNGVLLVSRRGVTSIAVDDGAHGHRAVDDPRDDSD